jgi:hypothetical protein
MRLGRNHWHGAHVLSLLSILGTLPAGWRNQIFIIAMKLFGGGFYFRCRKVLNMRLFPNDKNGKAWDQNVMQKSYSVLLVQ